MKTVKIFYKILIFLLIFSFSSYAQDTLKQRQDQVLQIKDIIQKEESLAFAYELFIKENLHIPNSIDSLIHDKYVGVAFPKEFTGVQIDKYNDYAFFADDARLTFRLKDNLSDEKLRDLYLSNTYRQKTFAYEKDSLKYIGIQIYDEHIKNLYSMLITQTFKILSACGDDPANRTSRYCIKDDDIMVYDITSDPDDLLMYYNRYSYKKGPYIIKNQPELFNTLLEFKAIPKGAIVYDFDGNKYIKTSTLIQRVQ